MRLTIAETELIITPEENYIQINDTPEPALRAAWPQIVRDYPGHEINFCYHNNRPPVGFMTEIGAEILDDSLEMRLPRGDAVFIPSPDILPVTEADFDIFAPFHDLRSPDMYWTSRRIKQDLSRWVLFMSQAEGQINGYVMTAMWDPKQAEFYAVEAPDLATGKALAVTAAAHAFEAGKPEILFMTDEGSLEKEIALALGFEIRGYYISYRIVL